MLLQALCIIPYPLVNSNWSYNPETSNLGQFRWLLELCDLEIWQMTLNKANLRDLIAATSLVILLKLDQNGRFFACVTLKFDWWPRNKANLRDLIAATGLVISNWIQIVNFSAHVTVKFDRWPCKTIRHLFYATSSFVHHFEAIGEFKLELQSGNAQSESNSEPCDLEIWRMTLQNNRAHLLCYFKLVHHFIPIGEFKLELQSGNAQSGSNLTIFRAVRPWNLMDDLVKQ